MRDYTKLVEALRICVNTAFCNECPLFDTCLNDNKLKSDAADAIEALQARVSKLEERTKAQQERLEDYMEKQLFIDQWGAKWMTSAKDVPEAAYQHGFIDGQAEAQLPKHGEWIDMGDFEQCSVCTGTHLKEFISYYGKATWVKSNYCPNCGAKMGVRE